VITLVTLGMWFINLWLLPRVPHEALQAQVPKVLSEVNRDFRGADSEYSQS